MPNDFASTAEIANRPDDTRYRTHGPGALSQSGYSSVTAEALTPLRVSNTGTSSSSVNPMSCNSLRPRSKAVCTALP